MRIAVVNQSKLSKTAVLKALTAVQKQTARDFAPAWGPSATLTLVTEQQARAYDCIAYLREDPPQEGVGGYHDDENGIPCIYVFRTMATAMGQPWSVLLSHEVLETLADDVATFYASILHPDTHEEIAVWLEVCDPVEAQSYLIDGVAVSDFVYPGWFAASVRAGEKTHHLTTTLAPGQVAPGGYIGFRSFTTGQDDTWFAHGDMLARRRKAAKAAYAVARRGSLRRRRRG